MAMPRYRDGQSGSLDQYLRDVSRHGLIDPAEERHLAKSIREGDQEAFEKLVKANLRFVISVAKKYQNRGVPLHDLIQEGNVGLVTAARKFDESKGVKFVSYAVWWIRQAILQNLAEQGKEVRIPLNRASERAVVHKKVELYLELGHTQLQAERLAAEEYLLENDRHATPRSIDEVVRVYRLGADSLDAPINRGEADSATYAERMVLEQESPDTQMDTDAIYRWIENTTSITDRERKILFLYRGLQHDGMNPEGKEHTLEEIGGMLGVTRERIRQIRNRAEEKLRERDSHMADYEGRQFES